MVRRAVARMPHGDFPRVRLRIRQKLLQGLESPGCVHFQHERRHADHADGRKLARRKGTRAGTQPRCNRETSIRGDEKRIAIRIGAGERLVANRAASPCLVFHCNGLAQKLAHLRPDNTRRDVEVSTGRKWDDHGDRLIRVALLCTADAWQQCQRTEHGSTHHGSYRTHLCLQLAATFLVVDLIIFGCLYTMDGFS